MRFWDNFIKDMTPELNFKGDQEGDSRKEERRTFQAEGIV